MSENTKKSSKQEKQSKLETEAEAITTRASIDAIGQIIAAAIKINPSLTLAELDQFLNTYGLDWSDMTIEELTRVILSTRL